MRDKQRLLEHQTTERDLLKNRLEKKIGVRTSCHGYMFRKITASWVEWDFEGSIFEKKPLLFYLEVCFIIVYRNVMLLQRQILT